MKDSGVAWIGEIPQGWEVKRMKDCIISNNRPQPNNTVLSLSYGKVIVKDMEEKKGVTPESYDSYQGVHTGDVVLRLTDLQNDQKSLRVGRATTKGIITSAYLCVSSRTLDDRYSAYLLHDVGDIQKVFYSLGGGVRQSMKFADLAELLFPLPEKQEQRAIADYLDRQTALIDQRLAAITDKKAVLAELRKAIIHEAVTKGLNKTGPMKDSGVAWIGEIPAHWTICRVKDKCTLVGGSTPSAQEIGDEFSLDWATPTDFDDITRTLECTTRKISAAGHKEIGKTLVREGAVLISCRAPAGKVAYVTSSLSFNQGCKGLIPKQRINSVYLFYTMVSMRLAIESEARGTTFQEISGVNLGRLHISFPPLPEQRAIADHLDRQTQQIDAQLATLDEQAQGLKELRKAMIHEAVTGKIDLSHYAPPSTRAAIAA